MRRDHPLRPIRTMVDEILKQLSPQVQQDVPRKWVARRFPPEQLLRAQLLLMLYSVRSARLLMEEMDYNILFRWFVGLNLDDAVWDATVFTAEPRPVAGGRGGAGASWRGWWGRREKRDGHRTNTSPWMGRCWKRGLARRVPAQEQQEKASAGGSRKSHGEFSRGEALKPDTRIENGSRGVTGAQRQVREAKLSYCGNLLVENRNGLIVMSLVWEATGTAAMRRWRCCRMSQETESALPVETRGFDTAEFVRECRNMRVTPPRGAKPSTKGRQRH